MRRTPIGPAELAVIKTGSVIAAELQSWLVAAQGAKREPVVAGRIESASGIMDLTVCEIRRLYQVHLASNDCA